MIRILPLLGVIINIQARFDLEQYGDPSTDLECPPKCVCSRWSCIDELDFAYLQQENKVYRLTNDQFDEKFRCWKHCCKKQGVVVSTCDRNVCQKCCNEQCVDIKSMIRMRRKFASETCNTCLQQHCAFSQEYTSVFTTRSCRGLFNKYSTQFNESITFQVEAERDLRIFLYDEPLSLLRNQLRKRRDADNDEADDSFPAEFESFLREQFAGRQDVDILDDPSEVDDEENVDITAADEAFIDDIMEGVYTRIRRDVNKRKEELVEQRKLEREKEREERKEKLKSDRKAQRTRKRLKKKSQKLLYGKTKLDGGHVKEQLEILDEKLFGKREENEMLYDYIKEEYENESDVDSRLDVVYELEPEELTPAQAEAAKRAEAKALRKAWREEQKNLDKLSDTFRRLDAVLQSDESKKKGEKVIEKVAQIQNDGGAFDQWTEKSQAQIDAESEAELHEDMLKTVLTMYGWETLSDNNRLTEDTLAIIEGNLQDVWEQTKKEKNNKSNRDRADWKRARIFHDVPESKVAEIKVKNKLMQQVNQQKESQSDISGKSISFLQNIWQDDGDVSRGTLEEGFADEDKGIHESILHGGWIQIGLGSSNNTACDLKSCQSSSYKRCIGVLRKKFPNILSHQEPQEITVSVTGQTTERILTVDITNKLTKEKRRIFEVIIDDPTIAQLNNMAVCTTKGSRGKLSFCCGNDKNGQSRRQSFSYFTDFRRMVDCQFSCLSSNCRQECMPNTQCDQCLEHNCGEYTTATGD